MILEVKFNSFRIFKDDSVLSFKADKRTKHLLANTIDVDNVATLKALALYGPNNSGKSNIISLFRMLKKILSGNVNFICNREVFNDSPITNISLIYNNLDSNGWIEYEFTYDSFNKTFLAEKLSQITYYNTGAPFKSAIFIKDNSANKLEVFGNDESTFLQILPSDKPFLYTINVADGKFANLSDWKLSLTKCAQSIEIISMYNIPIKKTIDSLKGKESKKINFIKSFVKAADVSIEDFGYLGDSNTPDVEANISEKALLDYSKSIDMFKLATKYNDKFLPSLFFDSSGTKKIEAIAAYIYESVVDGKILIVDELDNGLHYSLTRAIVSIFNNMINTKGQIFFTAHDLVLIDSNNLMRKEQIYFLTRKKDVTKLISLKSITASDGLREGDSLLKRYNHGDFGALPLPSFTKELINVLSHSRWLDG